MWGRWQRSGADGPSNFLRICNVTDTTRRARETTFGCESHTARYPSASKMSRGCRVSVEEIQSWWEVPAIAHFCSLFRTAFNLPDFEIEVNTSRAPALRPRASCASELRSCLCQLFCPRALLALLLTSLAARSLNFQLVRLTLLNAILLGKRLAR